VSIGKRLIDLARGELNSLLDRAARLDDEEETGSQSRGPRTGAKLQDLTDEELEAEIERRHLEKELRDGVRGRPEPQSRPGAGGGRSAPRPSAPMNEVARAYAVLEIPQGSDFETVRKAYRALMRKYHPDRHVNAPDKQKAATELAQKLTDAYRLLEKRLRK